VIILATIVSNNLVNKLIEEGKIDVKKIKGQWENYLIQTVKKIIAGVDEALVILGSDRRGTAYGAFDISKAIGVSPWYWWADVPIAHKKNILIKKGRYENSGPDVKYRGIFINDENPCLTKCVVKNYGSYNHNFYEKVYELILRLKGNFLWPAMWPGPREISAQAFFADDSLNHKTADEWHRADNGVWDYTKNKKKLRRVLALWNKKNEEL